MKTVYKLRARFMSDFVGNSEASLYCDTADLFFHEMFSCRFI